MSEGSSFDDLMDFPSVFVFRIICLAQKSLLPTCTAAIEGAIGRNIESYEIKPSSKGNLQSLRIAILVLEGSEIYNGFSALENVEGVKLVI